VKRRTMRICPLALALALACSAQQQEAADSDRANELVVRATAYNSTPEQTQGDPRLTASGVRLKPGMRAIAVSPDLAQRGLEFGTEVRIEGVPGTWEVVDRMPRGPRRIDLYFGDDEEAAREFGNRRVRIQWEAP
jgi:3D (Asp-Asp-Asp) domain-containing protein